MVRFYCLVLFLWWFVTDDDACCSTLGAEGGLTVFSSASCVDSDHWLGRSWNGQSVVPLARSGREAGAISAVLSTPSA